MSLSNHMSNETTRSKPLSNQTFLPGCQLCYCGQRTSQVTGWHRRGQSLYLAFIVIYVGCYILPTLQIHWLNWKERKLLNQMACRSSSYTVLQTTFNYASSRHVVLQTLLSSILCYPTQCSKLQLLFLLLII